MKKGFILIPALILMILCACSAKEDSGKGNVMFYYSRAETLFNQADGVLAPEYRQVNTDSLKISELITDYLEGPTDDALVCLFPAHTKLVSAEDIAGNLQIVLSDACRDMPQLKLTLSCAGLSKTLFGATPLKTITIRTESGFLYLEHPISFTRESILTEDVDKQIG